jgi:hypothetical protein
MGMKTVSEVSSSMSRRINTGLRALDRESHTPSVFARPFQRALLAAFALFLVVNVSLVGPLQAAPDEKKALSERATAFWEARVKGDWGVVYDFLAEGAPKAGAKEEFIAYSKENGPFHYISFKLGDIDVDGDLGWVKTAYDLEPMRFQGLRANHVDTWQTWEKKNGKWYPLSNAQQQNAPKLPPRLRPLKEENAVMARVDQYWQAREKNDLTALYQFISPAFREKVSVQEFLNQRFPQTIVDHQILWAEVQGDSAKVRVTVFIRPNDPNMTKMDPTPETLMLPWIKVNGQWYLDVKDKG